MTKGAAKKPAPLRVAAPERGEDLLAEAWGRARGIRTSAFRAGRAKKLVERSRKALGRSASLLRELQLRIAAEALERK